MKNPRMGGGVSLQGSTGKSAARTVDRTAASPTTSNAMPQTDERTAFCCCAGALIGVGRGPSAKGQGPLYSITGQFSAQGPRPFGAQARCRQKTWRICKQLAPSSNL